MSDGERITLTKSEELAASKSAAAPLIEGLWQKVGQGARTAALPTMAIVGLASLPLALKGGLVGAAALTMQTAEIGSKDFLAARIGDLGASLVESSESIIPKISDDIGTDTLARSISDRVATAVLQAGNELPGSVSIAERSTLKLLPNYEKSLPAGISSELNRDLSTYLPGENVVKWVNVDGEYRSFMTHIPTSFDPAKPAPMVVALDGFLVKPKNPYYGMANANGMIEQSDKLGFVAVFPVPKPRYQDQVFSWNEPSGSTNFLGVLPHSDTDYIKTAMKTVMDELPINSSRVYGVGFSQGALQLHDLVSKSPVGTFKAIAAIAGTTTEKLAAPPAGTKLLVIHSQGDPTLPYSGGTGTIPGMFDKIGWGYGKISKPYAQVESYLKANNLVGTEPIVTNLPDLTVKTWNTAQGETFVQEMLLSNKYGHTFPGTARDGSETFFTVLNGLAADRSILDGKSWITENFFGLTQPKSAIDTLLAKAT